MKRFFLVLLAFAGLCAIAADMTIVIPGDASPETRNAAAELEEHLAAALGGQVAVMEEGGEVSGRKIYLGDTGFARRAGLDAARLDREEARIRRIGSDIVITGGKPRGVLYGAYEFLERFAGVVWIDPHTTVIPKLKTLSVPEGTDLRIKPSFAYRGIFSVQNFGRNRAAFERNIRFRSRMRENVFWQEKFTPEEKARWGVTAVFGRPSPLNTLYFYIRDWPAAGMEDALCLVKGGKRARPTSIYGPGHVCFTSPKARVMFKKQILAFIAQDRKEDPEGFPRIYNISINDSNLFYCICDDCARSAAKYKAQSGPMLEFVNDIAEEVEKHYPDVTIQTSAYLFTIKSPVGIRPRRNVAVRYSFSGKTMKPLTHDGNRNEFGHLKDWSALGNLQIWNYWVNFSKYYPNAGIVNIDTIAENLRIFRKYHVDYVFAECEFPDTASFHPLRMYMGYQLMKDVGQDKEVLLDRFFSGYFGKAAGPMRRLYDYMNRRQLEHPDLQITTPANLNFFDRDYFVFTERCLAEAERLAAGDAAVLASISRERVPLDIARLSLRDVWKTGNDLPDIKTVHARLSKNWKASIAYWFDDAGWVNGMYHLMNTFLKKMTPPETGAKYPLPAKLKDRRCYDITWPLFTNVSEMKKFGLRLVDDPESCCGKAVRLGRFPEKRYGSLALVKEPHKLKFVCGIQSRDKKKALLQSTPEIPQNEKYDLIYIGRMTLTPNCVFWAHRSWAIQQDLDRYYRTGAVNTFDVYVSFKFEGPAYVGGSGKEDSISIDRIVLVEAEAEK
ncbi:MAG: DUF4838 domain-containing protein [Lentisphaeria bacterium]|nr:DUF4838 domain-containing protein [Lentisphaeria bacterium]